jgi:hypothetical protein
LGDSFLSNIHPIKKIKQLLKISELSLTAKECSVLSNYKFAFISGVPGYMEHSDYFNGRLICVGKTSFQPEGNEQFVYVAEIKTVIGDGFHKDFRRFQKFQDLLEYLHQSFPLIVPHLNTA